MENVTSLSYGQFQQLTLFTCTLYGNFHSREAGKCDTNLFLFFLLSLKRWAKLNQKIRLDLQPLHVQMLTLVLESYITWTQMWVSMHQTLYVQFFFLMYLDFGGFLEGYIPHTYVGHRNFKKNEKSKQHSQKD